MIIKRFSRLSAGRCLRSVFLLAVLGAVRLPADAAELRVWTSKSGKQLEATFERISYDSVKVRTPAGEPLSLDLERLSDMDIKYLQTVVEPQLEMTVRKRKNDEPRCEGEFIADDDNGYNAVTLTVDVRKKDKFPYDGTMRAEVIILGQEVGYSDLYRVVAKDVFPVSFPEESNGLCQFSAQGRFRTYVEYTGLELRGVDYAGYLIVLINDRGKVVHVETNLSWMNEPQKIERVRKMRYFNFLNSACQIRSVPQPRAISQ
jgi:hypothetical protein